MNAKCLILNHFSQRYKPISYIDDKKEMDCDPKTIDKNNNKGDDENENEIEDNVQKLLDEAKLNFDKSVLAAYDLFTYKI